MTIRLYLNVQRSLWRGNKTYGRQALEDKMNTNENINHAKVIPMASILSFLMLLLLIPCHQTWAEFQLIEDPKPTHVEKKFVEMEQVKVIDEEIDDENFFGKPVDIATGDDGSFYVYDLLLMKILKFGKNFKLQKTFLEKGQGPGEIQRKESGRRKMYFSSDGNLYVRAPFNKRISVFDKDGKLLRDIPIPFDDISRFPPVVDSDGNLYMLSVNSNSLNVFDKHMKLKYTLLSKNNYERFVVHKPEGKMGVTDETWLWPNPENTNYDIIGNNRLIVYLSYSSRAFIFEGDKLVNQYDILPEKALAEYRKQVERLKKKLGDNNFYTDLFQSFFVDKDDERFFYLSSRTLDGKKGILYKFDLTGKLINVLYNREKGINFLAKRNNMFYGLRFGQVHIYKIK
jgi:hypothetical protein